MPAKSQAQRAYLYATFGPDWVKRHHFDNKGPLPEHARQSSGRFASAGRPPKTKPKARRGK